jgi:hypothetical protein
LELNVEGGALRDVAVDAGHQIILEIDHYVAAHRGLQAARLEVIVVVPARVVECAGHHRRAQQVVHLAVRHADLDLGNRRRIQIIALLDRHAVNAAAQGPDGDK